jgi:hypothetical protein
MGCGKAGWLQGIGVGGMGDGGRSPSARLVVVCGVLGSVCSEVNLVLLFYVGHFLLELSNNGLELEDSLSTLEELGTKPVALFHVECSDGFQLFSEGVPFAFRGDLCSAGGRQLRPEAGDLGVDGLC